MAATTTTISTTHKWSISVAENLKCLTPHCTFTDENQDGHDGSYVDCYMKEHEGSTAETTRKQVVDMISDAWKQLNRECLSPNQFSANFTQGCLNTARMVPLMYRYEEHMKSIFHDSVSL